MIVLLHINYTIQYLFWEAPCFKWTENIWKSYCIALFKILLTLTAPLHYIYHTYRTLCESVDVRWVGVVNDTGPAHLWSDKQNKKTVYAQVLHFINVALGNLMATQTKEQQQEK